MSAERYERAANIFIEASQRLPAAREAYIDEACGDDHDLRAAVQALIDHDADPNSILGEDSKGGGANILARHLAAESDAAPTAGSGQREPGGGDDAGSRIADEVTPGSVIGRYKIVGLIGEGGFGAVYRAEQQQPVRRDVALKVIKLGMDTKQVIARFDAERQALAMMEHPNIARVFDAGATDTGRPYFVMELVRGIPITRYCDHNKLTTDERLKLFMTVCRAVQHAHQKGVIHRDLKPSNVLVSSPENEGGLPAAKVIDFGIAKAAHQRLTEHTMFTEHGQLIGTPQYMSPEQAETSALDIDTRSDIYSLGVILYELLTGTTPIDLKRLPSASYYELQRMIREDEPPRPSTRLSSLGADADEVAQRRREHLAHLHRTLRGDLDWIVMKALEKDRARRYETANGLAMDVQRYLDDEPVVASPPSTTYRLRKLIRRHKGPVAAAIAIAVLLVAGTAGTTIGMVRALRAEDDASTEAANAQRARDLAEDNAERARAEAETAEQVSEFLTRLFASPAPEEARGETILARDILDEGSQRIETELADQPEVQARLMETMGNAYIGLGAYDESRRVLEKALEIRRAHFGPEHESVAGCMSLLGKLLYETGDYELAEDYTRQSLAINRERLGEQSAAVALNLNDLGWLAIERGDHAEAIRLHREALAIRRELHGEAHPEIAESLNNLAAALHQRGDYAEAERLHREALAMRREVLGDDHPLVGYSLNNLAVTLEAVQDYEGAEQTYREALTMSRHIYGEKHADVATSLVNLGRLLTRTGKHAEAETMLVEAVEIDAATRGDDHPYVAYDLRQLGELRMTMEDWTGAEEALRKALEIYRGALPEDDIAFAPLHNSLAVAALATDRPEEATSLARESVRIWRKLYPDGHRRTGRSLETLARCLIELENYSEAEEALLAALPLIEAGYGEGSPTAARVIGRIVGLYEAWERPEDAETWRAKLPPPPPEADTNDTPDGDEPAGDQ